MTATVSPPPSANHADDPVVFVGGQFVRQSEARVSVLDHGLLYGDGVFETAFSWQRRLFKLDAHVRRGFDSMSAIGLASPMDYATMRATIIETVRRNPFANAYVKWIVTRGVNGRPLLDPAGCVGNVIVLVQPYLKRASDERARLGLALKTVAVRRPASDVVDPRVKSLNYLNLVLAKLEAKSAGADEALLLGNDGCVTEATGCNIFAVRGASLHTPCRDILFGITRETVMEIAREQGMPVHERDMTLYDFYTADEVFITSTAGGIYAVAAIDGRTIGSGVQGAAFAGLKRGYETLIASDRHATNIDEGGEP